MTPAAELHMLRFGDLAKLPCFKTGRQTGACYLRKKPPKNPCNSCAFSFAIFSLKELEKENKVLKAEIAFLRGEN